MSSRHLTLRRATPRAARRAAPAGAPQHADTARDAVAEALGTPVQPRLLLGRSQDAAEREADALADRSVGAAGAPGPMPAGPAHAEPALRPEAVADDAAARIQARRGTGTALPAEEQAFFAAELGPVPGHARIHADAEAARLARRLSAQAFTVGRDVYFGDGQYRPGTRSGRHLIAHELAHVRQQTGPAAGSSATTTAPTVQRKLELRPPGKGEASAFDRAQLLIDRLNTISPAIQYRLAGQAITYTVVNAAALTHFDKTMQGFIDRAELVPMRLINAQGRVAGLPLFADSFQSAYVDLDDLLADDPYSFQSDLLHFLTERFVVKDYDKKIGTTMDGKFNEGHRAGKDAEAAQLRALFKDPSIAFVYEESKPDQTWVNAFRSKAHGYWVFQVVKHSDQAVAGGQMWVQRQNGTRATIDEFRKERGALGP